MDYRTEKKKNNKSQIYGEKGRKNKMNEKKKKRVKKKTTKNERSWSLVPASGGVCQCCSVMSIFFFLQASR